MHILLIDPDADERALAAAVISPHFPTGRFEEIANGAGFASALARGGFDVVVSEYRLPWANGRALLESITESHPGVPVIFFTAVDDTELAVGAMRAGAGDYLVKSARAYLRLPTAIGDAVSQASARATPPGASRAEVETPGLVGAPTRTVRPDSSRSGDDQTLAELNALADAVARTLTGWGRAAAADEPAGETSSRLQRTNAELRELIAQAAHELDAPLRMITQHARFVEQNLDQPDEQTRRSLNLTLAGVGRMQELLDDFAAYARVEARQLTREPCDCNALVDRLAGELVARLGEPRVQLRRSELPTVLAEPSQLRQVFDNLFSNAVKFQAETQASVEVSARALGEEWLFSVRDHGIGVEPELADSIFKLFKRLHPEYPGTGVGLAICKRVVERHGGRIWVESQPGDGSTFHFTLPRDATRDGPGPLRPDAATRAAP